MELAAQIKDLVRRHEFWDELALSAPEDVLARLGCALSACAVLDGQVELAMGRAAEQASRRLEIAVDLGSATEGPPLRFQAGLAEAAPLNVPSASLARSDLSAESSCCSDSDNPADDFGGETDFVPGSASWLAASMPCPGLARLLPGLGTRGCRNAWIVLSVCLAVLECFVTMHRKVSQVGRIYSSHIVIALRFIFLALYIIVLVGIDGVAHHADLCASLRRRISKSSACRRDWVRFTHRACAASACLFAFFVALEVLFMLRGPGSFFAEFVSSSRLMQVGHMVFFLYWSLLQFNIAIFALIFAVVWKITWEELCEFCLRLEIGHVTDWTVEMRRYYELDRFVEQIWCRGTFAHSITTFILSMCTNIFLFTAMPFVLDAHAFSFCAAAIAWVLVHVVLLCTALYAMAKLQKKCVSTQLDDNSILDVGIRVAGRIPRQQRADHGMFLQCVMWNPVGVHVAPLGKVSGKMLYYYVRFAVVAVPAWVGLAALRSEQMKA